MGIVALPGDIVQRSRDSPFESRRNHGVPFIFYELYAPTRCFEVRNVVDNKNDFSEPILVFAVDYKVTGFSVYGIIENPEFFPQNCIEAIDTNNFLNGHCYECIIPMCSSEMYFKIVDYRYYKHLPRKQHA